MEKIASFTVNHLNLYPGIYVSRRDKRNECVVTTFDLRVTAPNREPVMDVPAIVVLQVGSNQAKKVTPLVYVLALLFILKYIFL